MKLSKSDMSLYMEGIFEIGGIFFFFGSHLQGITADGLGFRFLDVFHHRGGFGTVPG